MVKSNKDIKTNIHKLNDLEKNLRKMGLDILDPPSFLTSKLSYDFINRIIDSNYTINMNFTELYSEYNDNIISYKKFYKDIIRRFNFKHIYTPEKSLFNETIYPDIDELAKHILDVTNKLDSIALRL